MKDIFFISPSLPRFGGYKRRVDTAMSILKKFGKIRYYYISERKDVVKIKGAKKVPEPSFLEKVLNLLLNEGSFRISSAPSREAIAFMERELELKKPSLIYAHNFSAILLASQLNTDVPMVFDFTDALSLKFKQIAHTDVSPITALFSSIDSWIIDNLELELREDALALFITSRDARASPYGGEKLVLPNEPPKAYDKKHRKRYDVFLSGNFLYPPNARMLKHALDMKGKHSMLVVGKGASVPQSSGVRYLGVVKDYLKTISSAKMGFFPLDVAMGLQNKVLDSFSVGNPAIISKPVEEGLRDFLPKNSMAFSTLKEFTNGGFEECFESLNSDYKSASASARDALESYEKWFRKQKGLFEEYLSYIL